MKLLKLPEDMKDILRAQLTKQVEDLVNTLNVDTSQLKLSCDMSDLIKGSLFENVIVPTIYFTTKAWYKLRTMTQLCKDEIAGHGVVERYDNNRFLITDILVYPQEIQSMHVESTDAYGPWLMSLPDDVFPKIRFQFHSHVQMGVTPSGPDMNFYNTMLAAIKDYYIFMVFNKRDDVNLQVYDVEQGILFEDKDIKWNIIVESGKTGDQWYAENEHFISKPVRTYPALQPVANQMGMNEEWDPINHCWVSSEEFKKKNSKASEYKEPKGYPLTKAEEKELEQRRKQFEDEQYMAYCERAGVSYGY